MGTQRLTTNRLEPVIQKPSDAARTGVAGIVWMIRALVVLGAVAAGYYFSWWFTDNRLENFWLLLLMVCALAYTSIQLFGNWLLYLLARFPNPPPVSIIEPDVDVFVTAYREPYAMIERSLSAAVAMRGKHHTWLLDDGSDPALAVLANRLGAGYLARSDHRDAKAGNLNSALPHTNGELIAIFDIDHVAKPDFLERSVGYFADARVGFVQVMLTFDNAGDSWVAQAAMETSLEFYNPTYLGSDAVGGATMMGSNSIIRRKALEEIRGYQPGLAEDLATSLALHSSGWSSAYVPEPLAPGQAPPSFTAWFVQQLKWARGVFEMLLTTFPKVFSRLTWGQRLSYAVRTTRYWIGPAIGMHLIATIAILILGSASTRVAFHQYLVQITPLVVCDLLIRMAAMRAWRHPATPKTALTRAVTLVYATWPIYMLAWMMAVLRLPLSFRATPKSEGRLSPVWLLPQFSAVVLLTLGVLYTVFIIGHPVSILLLFAVVQATLQFIILVRWFSSEWGVGESLPRYLAALKSQAQSIRITRREVDGKVRSYLTELPFDIDPLPLDDLERLISLLQSARIRGAHQIIAGDRGSECVTRLLAHDLAQLTIQEKNNVWLVENEYMPWSQAGNWEETGEVQIIEQSRLVSLVVPGDLFLTIVQGDSNPGLVDTLKAAQRAGANSIAITGSTNKELNRLVDVNLHISSVSDEQFENFFLFVEHLIVKSLKSFDQEPIGIENGGLPPFSPAQSRTGQATSQFLADLPPPASITLNSRANAGLEKLLALKESLVPPVPEDQCLRLVLRTSLEVFDAQSGSLILLDNLGEAAKAAIAYEGEVHLYPPEHFIDTLQSGLASWVVSQRQPALVSDTRNDSRWLRRGWEEGTISRSAISVPLLETGRVTGVLTLAYPQAGRFNEADLLLLAAIAVHFPPEKARLETQGATSI